MKGKLVIFSAPSGSGKSTIINHLLKKGYPLDFSISATTRPPRGAEQHGIEYYFLNEAEFRSKIADNAFIEFEEVYQGRFYGTLRSEIERIWAEGRHVIFDVDVLGGKNLKSLYGTQALWVCIQPPSIEELRRRLTARGTETEQEINVRIARAEEEMSYSNLFDTIIVNSELDQAFADAELTMDNYLSEK